MTQNESPDGKTEAHSAPEVVPAQGQSVDESRRRFAKSGLAASGIILTLASRPVLGDWACQTPSGFQSGNVSTHGTPATCSGRTPGYWGTHPEMWPAPYKPGKCASGTSCTKVSNWSNGTKFNGIFNCGSYAGGYAGYSMMQVVWMQGNQDAYQLGAHIVAALLNATMGWTPVLTPQAVKDMFNEWAANGYYEPTAGVRWYAADIVIYLKTTMTL